MAEEKEGKEPAGGDASAKGPGLLRAPLRGEVSRRGLFSVVGFGWALFTGASVGMLGAAGRFLFPNVLYEPPQEFKAGFPEDFAVDQVDERFKAAYGVWLVRESTGFYALSTVCTHLGCTPNWLSADEKFKCPCHGSGFVKFRHQHRGAGAAPARALQDHPGRGRSDPRRQEHQVPAGEGAVGAGRGLPQLRLTSSAPTLHAPGTAATPASAAAIPPTRPRGTSSTNC